MDFQVSCFFVLFLRATLCQICHSRKSPSRLNFLQLDFNKTFLGSMHNARPRPECVAVCYWVAETTTDATPSTGNEIPRHPQTRHTWRVEWRLQIATLVFVLRHLPSYSRFIARPHWLPKVRMRLHGRRCNNYSNGVNKSPAFLGSPNITSKL